MNSDKYDIKKQFSWTRKYNYGPWSNYEHSQLVLCLKAQGLNWIMLKKMIPTRARQQIETHLKGYLKQIKKHYKVEDPLQYIRTSSPPNLPSDSALQSFCDSSPDKHGLSRSRDSGLYKFSQGSQKGGRPDKRKEAQVKLLRRREAKFYEKFEERGRERLSGR
ncbi:unnamed protein product [Moneuplotes crassus]|uniref:Myb-like domain-containing protein n=1 Tax=Euplotes crassus TaxID=5936 RepID=A0AAD1Y6Z4_EUPCR|nr:unnamed protein product [Moneuplotes crassus]